eukprot:544054_1
MSLFCSWFCILAAMLNSIVHCNDHCIDNFSRWFKNHNGKVSNQIKIKHELLSGYGIYATSMINKNQHILSVPVSLMISTEYTMYLLQQRIFNQKMSRKQIQVDICQKSKDILLSLGLLIEYNNKLSKWSPYFNCLPPKTDDYVNNLVISYSKQKLMKQFQASKIIQLIKERKQFIENSYLHIINNYKNIYSYINNFTLNEWIWALTI